MGKIDVNYIECSTLSKNIKKCIKELKDENDYSIKALVRLGKINENYYELSKIRENLNSIKNKSNSDINKLDNFERKLGKYVDNIKKSDNHIYNTI